jgi:hypothetical protein
MSTVVVVTTNPLSTEDAADLIGVAGGSASEAHFYLAVPEKATSASLDAVLSDWETDVAGSRGGATRSMAGQEVNPGAVARHDAKEVLDASMKALRDAGANADGEVTPDHPLDSIGDIVAHHDPAEVVVMVRHHHLSEATRSDLASQIRRRFKVETLKVKAH